MSDELKELQDLLARADALEAELRELDQQHQVDAATIAELEQRLSDRHQVKFMRGLAEELKKSR
jgi:hypothetical protein